MSLLAAFNQQCQTAPDTIAFIDGDRQLSYRQAGQLACQLSACLAQGQIPCQRVVIALDRGIDAAIAILAALNAGACYIPLDIKNPPNRLNYIITDADAQAIIGKGGRPDWLETSVCWLDINHLPPASEKASQPIAINGDALAAILYTSGSTGVPKGVALSHLAMRNFADWAASTFKIGASDHIASLTPFYFDLSVFDLFSSLSVGATVHFVPAGLTLSPNRLTSWLAGHHISVFYTVPSLLSFMALKGALATTPLPHLKTILFAGEVFPTQPLQTLCGLLPTVDFYNLYGPTETNVCCYWPVERERLQNGHPIPIGRPACGSVLQIDDVTGELIVQSTNNLSGYWQQGRLYPALTTDNSYRTGDKVSLNKHGEYDYHGRLDRMLKCSGFRVEPAEIEAVILQRPEVLSCVVIGITDNTSGQRPAAAAVLKPDAKLEQIVKAVKQQLPVYMHPCKFIVLESMPYLANGKTDYHALQKQLENS